ncbi:uncharacterized protein [Coffea arabica]|uniref:Serine-threonine/tyrosine-protein kinase catalytic domain-containing protein n=1 Tax=Coffea arabica TaxID=13443 RepID=A0ABM4VBL6_COFAR
MTNIKNFPPPFLSPTIFYASISPNPSTSPSLPVSSSESWVNWAIHHHKRKKIAKIASPFKLPGGRLCISLMLPKDDSKSEMLVHGDITLDNLLVATSGIVKIGDFSVSQLVEDDNDELCCSTGIPIFTTLECRIGGCTIDTESMLDLRLHFCILTEVLGPMYLHLFFAYNYVQPIIAKLLPCG